MGRVRRYWSSSKVSRSPTSRGVSDGAADWEVGNSNFRPVTECMITITSHSSGKWAQQMFQKVLVPIFLTIFSPERLPFLKPPRCCFKKSRHHTRKCSNISQSWNNGTVSHNNTVIPQTHVHRMVLFAIFHKNIRIKTWKKTIHPSVYLRMAGLQVPRV